MCFFRTPSVLISPYSTLMQFFSRLISSHGKQEVPGTGGFVSLIGSLPQKKIMIDYYEPVYFPITQYRTFEELLKHSEEATKAVGQEYVINLFDLGVCMMALPLVWQYQDQY